MSERACVRACVYICLCMCLSVNLSVNEQSVVSEYLLVCG